MTMTCTDHKNDTIQMKTRNAVCRNWA